MRIRLHRKSFVLCVCLNVWYLVFAPHVNSDITRCICIQTGQNCCACLYRALMMFSGCRLGEDCNCGSGRGNRPVSVGPRHLPGAACGRSHINSTCAAAVASAPAAAVASAPAAAAASAAAVPQHEPPNPLWGRCICCPILCFSSLHTICNRCAPTGEAPPAAATRLRCAASGAYATSHVPANVAHPSCRCLALLPSGSAPSLPFQPCSIKAYAYPRAS